MVTKNLPPPGGDGRKTTPDDELCRRLAFVEERLVQGMSSAMIVSTCIQSFGCGGRTAEAYIARVKRRWAHASRDRLRTKLPGQVSYQVALARREMIMRRAMFDADYDAALSAEQDRCKLEGLYPTPVSRSEISGPGGGPIQQQTAVYASLSVDERAASILAIITAAMQRRGIEGNSGVDGGGIAGALPAPADPASD